MHQQLKLQFCSDEQLVNILQTLLPTQSYFTMDVQRKTVILPGIKSTLDMHNSYQNNTNRTWNITCRDDPESEATILLSLATLGIFANVLLMVLLFET